MPRNAITVTPACMVQSCVHFIRERFGSKKALRSSGPRFFWQAKGPRFLGARKWVAPSAHTGQNLVGSHGDRRHAGVDGSLNSDFLYFSLPHARPGRVKIWSCTTSAPVPGSPTPRELAVADGSVRKYRLGSWSSWGSWFGQWSSDPPVLCDRSSPSPRPSTRHVETCPPVSRTAGSGEPHRMKGPIRSFS
jgi:hypothetical protein